MAGGGEDVVAKHKKRGKLLARERIEALQGGGLTDLLDDEEDEVTDDVGASIV